MSADAVAGTAARATPATSIVEECAARRRFRALSMMGLPLGPVLVVESGANTPVAAVLF